jgi:hypothetical protein
VQSFDEEPRVEVTQDAERRLSFDITW